MGSATIAIVGLFIVFGLGAVAPFFYKYGERRGIVQREHCQPDVQKHSQEKQGELND